MKNLVFSIFVLLISINLVFAQSSATIGTTYQEIGGKQKYFFDIGDFVYTVKIKGRATVLVQKIEKATLKETKSKMHENLLAENAETLNVFYSNNKFYIFTIAETGKGEFAIQGVTINQENLEAVGNKKIADVKGGIHKPYYQKLGEAFQSEDKSKFLVKCYKPLPQNKEDGITVGLYVIDTELETVGGNEMTMPYGSEVMDDMGYGVDNDGTINVAGYNLKEEAYHLVKINPKDMSTKIVSTENQNFSYCNDFALNGDKNKYVAGFYDKDGTTQMYFINLETSKSYEVNVPEDIVPYYKDKEKQKNTLMVHNAYVQEDGGLLVVAQELYGLVMVETNAMVGIIYNDFFVVRTNSDGTLKWIKRIKKEKKLEMSSPGNLNSPLLKLYKFYPRERYSILSKDGKHYFMFEDDKQENKGTGIYICNIDDESGTSTVNCGVKYDAIDKTKIGGANVKKTVVLGKNQVGVEVNIKKQGDVMVRVE